MIIRMELKGSRELAAKLAAMSAASSGQAMSPVVAHVADVVKGVAISRAPVKTGALRAGIYRIPMKQGKGYCYHRVGLLRDVYYGMFHEFGLGTGNPSGPSTRVQRRRSSFAETLNLRRRGYTSGSTGLSKSQRRRLANLERGRTLQGQRQPNMKARPFLRPSVITRRPWGIRYMVKALADKLLGMMT